MKKMTGFIALALLALLTSCGFRNKAKEIVYVATDSTVTAYSIKSETIDIPSPPGVTSVWVLNSALVNISGIPMVVSPKKEARYVKGIYVKKGEGFIAIPSACAVIPCGTLRYHDGFSDLDVEIPRGKVTFIVNEKGGISIREVLPDDLFGFSKRYYVKIYQLINTQKPGFIIW